MHLRLEDAWLTVEALAVAGFDIHGVRNALAAFQSSIDNLRSGKFGPSDVAALQRHVRRMQRVLTAYVSRRRMGEYCTIRQVQEEFELA